MIKKFTDKIPSILKNKYLLTGVAFLVLMLFFDGNDLISQYRMRKELSGLKKELQFYRDEAKKDSIELSELMGDSLELEKLGREKYLMKRDSEDIYIIVRRPAVKK
ncbi:MAG: septum formation initiator family protein [Bacteroidota bacterium]